jgi:hypothetical protein
MIRALKLRRAAIGAIGLAGLALPLCGCVDQVADFQSASVASAAVTPVSTVARRPGVSPRGAALALASLDGPPAAVTTRFAAALAAAAGPREITLADAGKARYLARGYVTAYPVEGGTAFAYVWDVFEGGRARAQRLSDAVVVKGSGGSDAWSLATDAVLADLAAKSADELAAFLSNTPEAIAAAKAKQPAVAAMGAPAKPLAYAPVD